MAYTAIYEGEVKGAFQVPHKTDAFCQKCGERVRVWRESEGGTARHFKHISEMGGGSGGGSGCSGGEGDKHIKWKNFAAERLGEVFDGVQEVAVEKRLAAPHTDKEHRDADAIALFEDRDDQLGLGIAVEVQHKNRDKDIEATTRDYLKQDIAVAWLYEDDFTADGCPMAEIDFRDRAADGVNPLMFRPGLLPHGHPPRDYAEIKIGILAEQSELTQSVLATLPKEWHDDTAQKIWANQNWSKIVAKSSNGRHPLSERDVWHAREYLDAVANEFGDADVTADIPFLHWAKTQQAGNIIRDIRASYDMGYQKATNRVLVKCAHCGVQETHHEIHDGEIRRGSKCGNCGEWYSIECNA